MLGPRAAMTGRPRRRGHRGRRLSDGIWCGTSQAVTGAGRRRPRLASTGGRRAGGRAPWCVPEVNDDVIRDALSGRGYCGPSGRCRLRGGAYRGRGDQRRRNCPAPSRASGEAGGVTLILLVSTGGLAHAPSAPVRRSPRRSRLRGQQGGAEGRPRDRAPDRPGRGGAGSRLRRGQPEYVVPAFAERPEARRLGRVLTATGPVRDLLDARRVRATACCSSTAAQRRNVASGGASLARRAARGADRDAGRAGGRPVAGPKRRHPASRGRFD